ncbi:hypothetical protein LAZ67_X001745 [Cordylochernes scorpioides]|uniref:lysozyme n=1 Tax=Cordylochernes scorpioides TaxID=51811 RepID=A0ABY6LXM7_9ARAC|nr:hypothetical protein LAZ67_X001745 [Cordylochernes scorpioides]
MCAAHVECLLDKNCATATVVGYMTKYRRDCDGDGHITCQDYALIHKAGPLGCNRTWPLDSKYWRAFAKCWSARTNDGGLSGDGLLDPRNVTLRYSSIALYTRGCCPQASTGCLEVGCQQGDATTVYCGPYAVSYNYWLDGGQPGSDARNPNAHVECLLDKNCATATVVGYMTKYRRDCDGDGHITCQDYALIHKAGPLGCNRTWPLDSKYWRAFAKCWSARTNDGGLSGDGLLDPRSAI